MTRILLIRHASHDLLGRALAGRTRDISLNAQGQREAALLADHLAGAGIDRVFVSPRRRTHESVAPLARRLGLAPEVDVALDEVDFGDWSGRSFAELSAFEAWAVWVELRSIAQPPNGEAIVAVQRRIVSAIERISLAHAGYTVALVSHCDVIKAALAHYLGLSLDHLENFEIAPASVSMIALGRDWARVKLINATGPLASA